MIIIPKVQPSSFLSAPNLSYINEQKNWGLGHRSRGQSELHKTDGKTELVPMFVFQKLLNRLKMIDHNPVATC